MKYGYLPYNGNIYLSQLEVGTNIVRCFIRGKWLSRTPEEIIRQSILAFLKAEYLHERSHLIDIYVERSSIDIAIYPKPQHQEFRPSLGPILLIETKREEIQPLDNESHEHQIQGYMQRTHCAAGILTNSRELWYYKQKDGFFSKHPMTDLAELIIVCDLQQQRVAARLDEHQILFTKAQTGNYDCFRTLVELYGRGTDIVVAFSFERNRRLIQSFGFMFKNVGDSLQFTALHTETSKRQMVTREEFCHLSSITARNLLN